MVLSFAQTCIALGRADCPQPAVGPIEERNSRELCISVRERTARRAVPTKQRQQRCRDVVPTLPNTTNGNLLPTLAP